MISVIMSVYNEPLDFIQGSVESILNQSVKTIELVIVIDDPKNVKAIDYITQRGEQDSRIKVIINEENLGLVKSLNKALSVAGGDFIARMDADDISNKKRLEKQLVCLQSLNLDLVGCNVCDMYQDGCLTGKVTNYPVNDRTIKEFLRYDACMPHPSWLGKRSVFDELNGYQDIDACEDYDFLVRGALKGFKYGNVKEPLLRYRLNEKGISYSKRALQKTSLYFIRKRYREGLIVDEGEYKEFVRSGEGCSKLRAYKRYYSMSRRLKECRNKFTYLFYGAYMYVTSSEARRTYRNIKIEEKISRMDKR